MENVFNFKRFAKYFAFDFIQAKRSYWLSLLLVSCCPVICFVIYEICNCFLHADFALYPMPAPLRASILVIAIICVALSAPTKIYGFVTERRLGSNWLLIPASSLEKALSMILMMCVVVPAIMLVLMFGTDALLSLAFGNVYGESLIKLQNEFALPVDQIIELNLPAVLYLNWCETILSFTLGAIFFKKAKISKTILVVFLAGTVIGSLTSFFFFGNVCELQPDSIVEMLRGVNFFSCLMYTIILTGLMLAIFFRIKTLKK